MVQPRHFFLPLHTETDVGDAVAALGDTAALSVSRAKSIQQLDSLEQSVRIIRVPFWREGRGIEVRVLAGSFCPVYSSMDTRQLRRMAVWISIRDDLPAVPLRDNAGKLAEETDAARVGRVRILIRREHLCDMVVQLDGVYEVVGRRDR